MRFAIADPPYIGQAKRHYAKEAAAAGRVASEVDHRALLERLETYDGWALCLSSPSLLGPDGIAAMCGGSRDGSPNTGGRVSEPEFDPRACGSCGGWLARLEVGLCALCRVVTGTETPKGKAA